MICLSARLAGAHDPFGLLVGLTVCGCAFTVWATESGNRNRMDSTLLTAELVRARLGPLTLKQIDRLAALSMVPSATIYKIKLGTTANPGLETVNQFWPHIDAAQVDAEPPATAP